MSSITVGDLQRILEDVPEEYEVVMETTTNYDVKAGTSYAYINGIREEKSARSIFLMN